MILKLSLINRHVDLSHIQSVGPAYFNNLMGSGGWFVGFSIDFILRDKPVHYEWQAGDFGNSIEFRLADGPFNGGHWAKYEDETWTNNPGDGRDHPEHGRLVCLKVLDERILRDIVEPWKAWKDTVRA